MMKKQITHLFDSSKNILLFRATIYTVPGILCVLHCIALQCIDAVGENNGAVPSRVMRLLQYSTVQYSVFSSHLF